MNIRVRKVKFQQNKTRGSERERESEKAKRNEEKSELLQPRNNKTM